MVAMVVRSRASATSSFFIIPLSSWRHLVWGSRGVRTDRSSVLSGKTRAALDGNGYEASGEHGRSLSHRHGGIFVTGRQDANAAAHSRTRLRGRASAARPAGSRTAMPRRRSRMRRCWRLLQIGAVENLAVAQLPLHVAHDTLPQGGHAGQVVCECRIHDAKDALPAFSRMSRLNAGNASFASWIRHSQTT